MTRLVDHLKTKGSLRSSPARQHGSVVSDGSNSEADAGISLIDTWIALQNFEWRASETGPSACANREAPRTRTRSGVRDQQSWLSLVTAYRLALVSSRLGS